MARIWRLYDGDDPPGGRGPWIDLPLSEAVSLLDLRPKDFVSGPGPLPVLGGNGRDLWFGGYRHVLVEVRPEEAGTGGWRPGYYRSRVRPKDALGRLIARPVASALGDDNVVRVRHETTIDSEGRDALKITIVLAPGAIDRLPAGATMDALVQVQQRLFEMKDERLPILHYATEAELAEHAGLEP